MDASEFIRREIAARAALKSSYVANDDEYGVTLFVSHHLEELKPEYWQKQLGVSSPDPLDILKILQLKTELGNSADLDFTLPDGITDYVVCVRFDESGNVIEIDMES